MYFKFQVNLAQLCLINLKFRYVEIYHDTPLYKIWNYYVIILLYLNLNIRPAWFLDIYLGHKDLSIRDRKIRIAILF